MNDVIEVKLDLAKRFELHVAPMGVMSECILKCGDGAEAVKHGRIVDRTGTILIVDRLTGLVQVVKSIA